jgi:fructokinase
MGETKRKFKMVGLGEILWDILPEGRQLGGAPANFAYHAQALGAKGIVVSCVGGDDLGRQILRRLDEMHIDRKHVAVDKGHPTGTVTVELDSEGKPDFTIHENVAWDYIPLSSELLSLAPETDAVCFGSLCQRSEVSRKTVRSFLLTTRPDCIRIFDINIRQSYYDRAVVNAMLELSNVLKLNDEELPIVASLLSIEGSQTSVLSRLIQQYDLSLIALTKGAKGSRLYTGSRDSECKAAPTDRIADTVGAGDAFSAAIAIGWLRGDDLDKINADASRVASFVCSQRGATPQLPEDLVPDK